MGAIMALLRLWPWRTRFCGDGSPTRPTGSHTRRSVRAAVEGWRSRFRAAPDDSGGHYRRNGADVARGFSAGGEQTPPLGRVPSVGGSRASTADDAAEPAGVFALVQAQGQHLTSVARPNEPAPHFYDEDKVKLFEGENDPRMR